MTQESYQTIPPTPSMQASPIQDTSASEQATSKKKKILIIVLLLLFTCCCITSASAAGGYIIWKSKQDETDNPDKDGDDQDNNDDQDDSGDQDDDGDLDDGNDGDDQDGNDGQDGGDGQDDNDGSDGSDDNGNTTQPGFSTVIQEMEDLTSYRMKFKITMDTESMEMNLEYQAPNKQYMTTTSSGYTMENIVIGDTCYNNYGSEWEESPCSGTELISDEMFDSFTDDQTTITAKGEKDGYWYYTLSAPQEDMDGGIYVDKSTNRIVRIDISDPNGPDSGIITYSDYNDSSIKIIAPI